MPRELFAEYDLSRVIDRQKTALRAQVDEISEGELLARPETDLVADLVQSLKIEPPVLNRDGIEADHPEETEIDVTGHPRYDWGRAGRGTVTRKGALIRIHVPYEGEAQLFDCSPSMWTTSSPFADVEQHELILEYRVLPDDNTDLRQRYQRDLDLIDQYLQSVRSQVEQFMRELEGLARSAIAARKQRLSANRALIDQLDLPVRRVPSEVEAVSLPPKRRKATVSERPSTGRPREPEPYLPHSEYEYILDVVGSISLAIERSPSTFRSMEEEQLRDLLLIQLNGHYEGGATGETFNAGGKTDILIRVRNKNIFIGECKIWSGKKALLEAIDQLSSYTCWSDTKCALIVFDKNRDHSAVLRMIRESVPQHRRFRAALNEKGETQLRYRFEHPQDKERDLYLAVITVPIPIAIDRT